MPGEHPKQTSTGLVSSAAQRPSSASTSPCYRCLYVEADESLGDCAGNGVLAPVPGVVGTIMAAEALKYLAGINSTTPVLRLSVTWE